jgi:hypothetical protein
MMMMAMTPEQEAAYALNFEVSRSDLRPEVQAAYDRLAEERQQARQERERLVAVTAGSRISGSVFAAGTSTSTRLR